MGGGGNPKPKKGITQPSSSGGKPTPTPTPAATPQKPVKRKPTSPQGPGEPPAEDEEKRKAAKKEIDAKLAKCVKAKLSMDSACAACSDVLGLISKDTAWKWADNDAVLQPLRKARSKVEGLKESNFLGGDWLCTGKPSQLGRGRTSTCQRSRKSFFGWKSSIARWTCWRGARTS